MTDVRQNRFSQSSYAQSGIEAGYGDVNQDPLNNKMIRTNIREYKTLKKFGKKGGLRKLANKNYAQLEKMAVRAVLKKNKVKRRKLKTKGVQAKYGARVTRIARKRISQGYSIRDRSLGQQGKSVSAIKNKKVRKAAKMQVRVRRNRRINRTKLMAGKGYDISKGIR